MQGSFLFSSESVTEGHPDKICDLIADNILDAYFTKDLTVRINCEVLVKSDQVVLSGEITSSAEIDHEYIVRKTIRDIGYTQEDNLFHADRVNISHFFTKQASEISQGVNTHSNRGLTQGAGDQGMMFGYAVNETPQLMPLPIMLAHNITRFLADDRRQKQIWLKPDGKAQVSVRYKSNKPIAVEHVVVSLQHQENKSRNEIIEYVYFRLLPIALGDWFHKDITLHINPTGSFIQGGPEVDSGLTGRKIIVDTYGGMAPHGGGSLSGKDPSKVDRSGAYFARFVAREIVKAEIASKALVQVAYAIGEYEPVSLLVNCLGTGNEKEAEDYIQQFDFRPAAIIKKLDLLKPIYAKTTNYGHFGKPNLPWEQ